VSGCKSENSNGSNYLLRRLPTRVGC